jgi:hypothetical protein
MAHQPYPLEWPVGRKRTTHRSSSKFRDLSFARTRDDLLHELKLMHADGVVLSTNISLRVDGLPLAGQRQPADPGVAIYFSLWDGKKKYFAIACDAYYKVEENMRALVHTIEAMRTIRRHGSSDLLEQAMSGFAALPPGEDWWKTLGFTSKPTLDEAKSAWRGLVQRHHPDRGGKEADIRKFNAAMELAELELSK